MKLSTGALVAVKGGVLNVDSLHNEGTLHVDNDYTNDQYTEGNGYYHITGDWENNQTFISDTSTVELNNLGDQNIKGSAESDFHHLTISGSGIKYLALNSSSSGLLSLNDLELATDIYTFQVHNTDTAAITRTSGFISSLSNGGLSRDMNQTSIYLFPVGSSAGTARYRPIEITPSTAASHTYKVRMANVDATTEGYDVSLKDANLCSINPDYYHQISQVNGSAPGHLTFYFDNVVDQIHDSVAQWQSSGLWSSIGTTTQTLNTSPTLSSISKSLHSDFSEIPFALAVRSLDITLTSTELKCANDSNGVLHSTVVGGLPPLSYLWEGNSTADSLSGLPVGTYQVVVSDVDGCKDSAQGNVTSIPEMAALNPINHVSCKGDSTGSMLFSVSGGTPPYQYVWHKDSVNGPVIFSHDSTMLDSLWAGIYIAEVTDSNNCVFIRGVQIQEPASSLHAASVIIDSTTCALDNGLIIINAGGGTAPYTYNWSTGDTIVNSIDSLAKGNYLVTITDANNCDTIMSLVIDSLPSPELSLNAISSVCLGDDNGTVTSSIIDGASPYTYSWSNGAVSNMISNLIPGTYRLTITDANNCSDSSSVVVDEGEQPPTVMISANSNSTCISSADGSATANAAGNAPLDYLWSNNITSSTIDNLGPGIYKVTVTDVNNCAAVDSIEITNLGIGPNVTVEKDTNITVGNTVRLIASGGDTYEWFPTESLSTSDTRSVEASPTENTTYSVVVTNSLGCVDTGQVTVTVDYNFDLNVPNVFSPNEDGQNDRLFVVGNDYNVEDLQFVVYDRWGEQVFESNCCCKWQCGWDGKLRGVPMNPGVFVYVLKAKLDGKQIEKHGNFTLVRNSNISSN